MTNTELQEADRMLAGAVEDLAKRMLGSELLTVAKRVADQAVLIRQSAEIWGGPSAL